jgi:hypothetical protein
MVGFGIQLTKRVSKLYIESARTGTNQHCIRPQKEGPCECSRGQYFFSKVASRTGIKHILLAVGQTNGFAFVLLF